MIQSDAYNMDCMEFMQACQSNAFALAIADPPYGLDASSTQGAGKLKTRVLNTEHIKRWDEAPRQDFFMELRRVARHVIIWGGNYFPLGTCRCFVCWDKCQPWDNFSQAEFAWTDFDAPAKMFTFDNRTGDKIHPTQKPVELYAYLLRVFANKGDRIFDPMMGSQSSRIAAYKMGFDYVGCELDNEYFIKGCERFDKECKGETKTSDGHIIKQTSLFDI